MWLALLGFGLASALLSCGRKTLLVPVGTPVMVRTPAELDVWVPDETGKLVPGRITAPVGWWLLNDDEQTTGGLD